MISIHALLAESDGGVHHYLIPSIDFYPRSPCGERPPRSDPAPRRKKYFYPRSPCGERRIHYDNYNLHCVISIHALLAESDARGWIACSANHNFYPRSPCGERPVIVCHSILNGLFLSTLSLRRATAPTVRIDKDHYISIHALLAESDAAGRVPRPRA